MKPFILFLTSAIARLTYIFNATSGNWTDDTKWQGGVSPSAGGTNYFIQITGANSSVTLNTNTVLNELQTALSSAGTATLNPAASQTLTFDGITPKISSSTTGRNITITARVILNKNLSILPAGSTTRIGLLTSNGKDITQTSSTGGTVRWDQTGNTGVSGGNYYLNGGQLLIIAAGALNGASGPKIWYSNTNSGSVSTTGASQNTIEFTDTGSNDFTVSTGTTQHTGTYIGSITKLLNLGGNFAGSWSGFSTTNTITVGAQGTLTVNSASFPTVKIQIGQTSPSQSGGSYVAQANAPASNNFDVLGGIGSAITNNSISISNATTKTLSGNIVLNSNQSTVSGNVVSLSNPLGGSGITFSGVISNAASNADKITLQSNNGTVLLTGTSTYTSPTLIAAGGEFCVNGSIGSSSLITLSGAAAGLSGRGTVGPVTMSTAACIVYCYSRASSPAVTDTLTVSGNFTMTSTTAKLHVYTSATPASSKLIVNGNVSFSAGAAVVIGAGSTAMTSGQSATIITYTGTSSGTLTAPTGYTISDVSGTITLTKT